MDYHLITAFDDTVTSHNELFIIIVFTLYHFLTTLSQWIKYFPGINLELLSYIYVHADRKKELIYLLILNVKCFVCVTKCNESVADFKLINYTNMLNNSCKGKNIKTCKNYQKLKFIRRRPDTPCHKAGNRNVLNVKWKIYLFNKDYVFCCYRAHSEGCGR